MLEIEPTGPRGRIQPLEMADTATKPSPAPLQKHLLGGGTIDMHPWNCMPSAGGHTVSPHHILFNH